MNNISVIGFGKIGQAVAANILRHGIDVVAIDINPAIEKEFVTGKYETNEPGLKDILVSAYDKKKLSITSSYAAVKGSIAIIISIPLIINDDKKILDAPFLRCMEEIAEFCDNNTVLVIETSMPVGFSRKSVLAALTKNGKVHGKDFLLAHSPERIKSGTMLEQLSVIPKVLGGIDEQATDRAYEIYQSFFDKQLLKRLESIEAAELVKLAGMIYRDVNIALANQLAKFAGQVGIAFTDIISLINTDREANLLQPGIGVGGHCTPVYPYFLINNFREAGLDFSIARESRVVNNEMAAYAVSLVLNKLQSKKALLLGLSFRPNVKEDSLSTTYILKEVLDKEGFELQVHDVEFSAQEINAKGLHAATDIYETGMEVVFLVTMHKEYADLDLGRLAKSGIKYFVDGRNAFERSRVEEAGMEYFGIGR